MWAFSKNSGIPSGAIIEWSGSIASIPSGYVLCDGNNSTPNLTDKFIIGAGNTYNPDDNAADTTHGHSISGQTTSQPSGDDTIVQGQDEEADVAGDDHTHTLSGVTVAGGNLPPYYALAYIMKT